MSAHIKSMILTAQDDIEIAKKYVNDDAQHDIAGYNLAQACEKFLKALCEMKGVEYPGDESGKDLDYLMELLEENNYSAISSHADIVELTQYNNPQNNIRMEDRLDLVEYLGYVEDLKKLIGEELKMM